MFFGDCMEWPGDFDAGIVEGDIETAMGGQDKLERLLDVGILGDICANKGGGAAVLGDRRGDVRAFLGFGPNERERALFAGVRRF